MHQDTVERLDLYPASVEATVTVLINALAVCLNRKNLGELVDEFAGLADLSKGRVRVLHGQSFPG